MTVLSVQGLCKSFGGVVAARDVSFDVQPGELLALIGPNGAGKTTTFNMVGGQLRPDAGAVVLDGADVTRLTPREKFRRGVGRTFQVAQTFPSMTVAENVQMALISHAGETAPPRRGDRAPRAARHGRLRRPAGLDPCLWRRQARRARDRAREPAEAFAHGRADRRHGPARARRADGAHRDDRPRAPHRRAVHRARHGRGLRPCRPHPRAGARRDHRRRIAGGRAGERARARGLSRRQRRRRRARRPGLGVSALLEVEGLSAFYGRAQILFDVALALEAGEVASLMGRNGAGKTTTLKAIMGLVDARAERLVFAGRSINGLASYRVARAGLGYVPEDRRIFTDLTVFENLEVGRRLAPDYAEPWTPERLFSIFPNLAEMHGRRASEMSGGEQQMLTIARTLMGNPRAVLLDEPSEGLAPVIVELMARAVLAMKAEGVAVLLCEQNLAFAAAVSDRAYVIERGQIRFEGTIAALSRDETMRDAYLGV